jgi:hypothetical protein
MDPAGDMVAFNVDRCARRVPLHARLPVVGTFYV